MFERNLKSALRSIQKFGSKESFPVKELSLPQIQELLTKLLDTKLGYFPGHSQEQVHQFINTSLELRRLEMQNTDFEIGKFMSALLEPIVTYSPFSLQNNKLSISANKNLFEKLSWLKRYPNEGRNDLVTEYPADSIKQLADQLKDKKVIILGEIPYVKDIQQTVGDLVLAVKKENPARKIVVFTEYMKLPWEASTYPKSLESYSKHVVVPSSQDYKNSLDCENAYAKEMFQKLIDNQVEVYPLENPVLTDLLERSSGLYKSIPRIGVFAAHNKGWKQTIEAKMAEIRQTDPEAVFIVYADIGHTSWLVPYSLPEFFVKEKPIVVEIMQTKPSSMSSLYSVWGKEDPFFKPRTKTSLSYWQGANAQLLGKQTGFDYMLVLAPR